MAKRTLLTTASTHNIFRRTGTFYGLTMTPVVGSTVVVADLADQGATGPDMNARPPLSGSILVLGPFPANSAPLTVRAFGTQVQSGITVSISSTPTVAVFYD